MKLFLTLVIFNILKIIHFEHKKNVFKKQKKNPKTQIHNTLVKE